MYFGSWDFEVCRRTWSSYGLSVLKEKNSVTFQKMDELCHEEFLLD